MGKKNKPRLGSYSKTYSSPFQSFTKFVKQVGSLGCVLASRIVSPGPSAGSAGQLLLSPTHPKSRGNGIQLQGEGGTRQEEDLLSGRAWPLQHAIKAGG